MTLSGPEITIEAMELLVEWLYTKGYDLKPISKNDTQGCYMQLASLFVLAEKYIMVDLKNNIVDQLFELQAANLQPPQIPVVEFIYENTPVSSPFRLLLAAYSAWHVDMDWCAQTETTKTLHSNPCFAADLAVQMGKRLSGKHNSPYTQPASLLYSSDSESCIPRNRLVNNGKETQQTDILLEPKKGDAQV